MIYSGHQVSRISTSGNCENSIGLGYLPKDRKAVDILRSSYTMFHAPTVPMTVNSVAIKRYQAVGFRYNRMLKLSSSRGIRI